MYNLQTVQFVDASEERILVGASQDGDTKARNKLLVSLIPMIVRLTERMVGAGHPQFEDYVQEGILGNIVGIKKFDLEKFSIRYYTYGYWWIRIFIDRERKLDYTWNSSIADDIDKCFIEESSSNIDDPPENPFDSTLLNSYIKEAIVSIPPIFDNTNDIIEQFRTGGVACHFDLLDEMLNLCNGEINEKQRTILRLKYHEGWTYKRIGDKFGCSATWIMVLRKRAINELKIKCGV